MLLFVIFYTYFVVFSILFPVCRHLIYSMFYIGFAHFFEFIFKKSKEFRILTNSYKDRRDFYVEICGKIKKEALL